MRMDRYLAHLFAFLAVTFWFVGPSIAATMCWPNEVQIPELSAATLGQGDHVVAQTVTPRGPLQVHVTVKGKTVSNPTFLIAGKRLKKTAIRRVPKDLRDCLQQSRKAANLNPKKIETNLDAKSVNLDAPKKDASLDRQQIAFVGPIQQLGLYSPRTDVRFRGRCKVQTSCNQNICCALATCGREQAVWCEGY